MSKEIKIKLTQKQSLAYALLTNQYDVSLMYGGAKGGGKTFFFCMWTAAWVKWLIEYFGIKADPTGKTPPVPLGFIGRKQAVDFRKTTLDTFQKVIPPDWYKIKEHDGEIIFWDCALVYIGGLDDRKTINKFNSAEFAFFGIDQAEETERTDVDVLQAALRLKHNEKQPPYKQLYTANPADCWLKEDFIDQKLPNHYFIPALYTDNAHLPTNYSQTLSAAFRYNPALLSAYKDGSWFALKAANALLSSQALLELKDVHIHPGRRKGVIVCDPSLGGDECVIKVMENYKTIDLISLQTRQPMIIAGEMLVAGQKYKIPNYAADTTGGLGEAILDRIREIDQKANRIYLSYATHDDSFRHGVNLKAEMCWNYMEKVLDKKIPYPEDEETRRQLLALRFKVINSQGHIIMEPKEDVRKRIERSPDRAECEIMGVWALDHTEPIVSHDAWRDELDSKEIGSGAHSAMAA